MNNLHNIIIKRIIFLIIVLVPNYEAKSQTLGEGNFLENSDRIYHIALGVLSATNAITIVSFGTLLYKYIKLHKCKTERLLQNYVKEIIEECDPNTKNLAKLEQLQKELGKRKDQFKLVWEKAPLYADWRKEEFKVVNLTLDENTAHPNLLLCEKRVQVTCQEKTEDLPSSIERFDSLTAVLGELKITEGRFYWEVEVEYAYSFDLGICRNDVARKGRVILSPKNGFWAIRLYNEEYWALSSPETLLTLQSRPLRVGIFLDLKNKNVSFYNMTDNCYIYSFENISFSGTLRPFFRLWSSESGSLTLVQ